MTQPDFWIESQPPCPAIVFNFSQSLPEEIARFDSKGFYYKGEFIDDAGEVHRLLKQVLEGQLNIATTPPEPPTVMEALSARPLLEQVARLGDCIGANTVGKIMAISSRAAAWLEANPPGQPVAIEPRGCPTPGACSCVEPATPPPEPPKPPTDEELWAIWNNHDGPIPAILRAALERWGR
jgi:hypothetical protein